MKISAKTPFCAALAVVLFAFLLPPACSQKELPAAQKKALRYPRWCAGVNVAGSTDADVRRRYGKGYFVADEGHGGGRYYLDPKHQVTLHIVIGVDKIIDAVGYQQGVHLPTKPSARILRQATTRLLSADKPVQQGLALGASAQSILGKYGKPKKDTRKGQNRVIVYATDYTVTKDVLFYAAEFHFRANRLVSVQLENGE